MIVPKTRPDMHPCSIEFRLANNGAITSDALLNTFYELRDAKSWMTIDEMSESLRCCYSSSRKHLMQLHRMGYVALAKRGRMSFYAAIMR